MKKRNKKRRNKKDCKYYDIFDEMITCDNPRTKICVCTGICKLFKPYVKPFTEKEF